MLKDRKNSAETKAKMSAAKKGEKNPMFGKTPTEETRRKLSAAKTGEKHPMFGKKGEKSPNWKGGVCMTPHGYWRVWLPGHPHADSRGYIFEHRLIMEAHLGRLLLLTEVVHHINGDKADNRIKNLMLFADNNKHLAYHKVNNLVRNRHCKVNN